MHDFNTIFWENFFFESLRFYSPDFVGKVRESLPRYVAADSRDIAATLGIQVLVDESGISYKDERLLFADPMLQMMANPQKMSIDVICGGVNMALDARRRQEYHERTLEQSHPLRPENRLAYSTEGNGEQHLVWYDHNILDGLLPLQLLFRNFAIAFNNLALKEL